MLGYAQSLTSGTPKVVDAVNADNGAPSGAADVMAEIDGYGAIDLVATCSGAGGSYDIEIWWYYAALDAWMLDNVIGTIPVTTALTTSDGGVGSPLLDNPPNAASGVYVRVLNFAGGGVATVSLFGRKYER